MSSTSTPAINYAKYMGFESVPAAVVFGVLYLVLFALFIGTSIKHKTSVYYSLAFFCALRIIAFAIRAVLAGSESAAENLGLLTADEILFGGGFFGLVYSAYTLVLDLVLVADHPAPRSPILKFTQSRKAFRLVMTIAVVMGITSSVIGSSHPEKHNSTATTLREISTVIFFLLTVLNAFQTIYYAKFEMSESHDNHRKEGEPFGKKHGIFILVVISLLLLVREGFVTVTINNRAKQNDESFWYTLVALPEILAVALYSIPGLVPGKKDLPKYTDITTTIGLTEIRNQEGEHIRTRTVGHL